MFSIIHVAGEDFEYVLTTVYFRPLHDVVTIYISILNDSVQEGKEQFTVELSAFDLSIILVNSVAEVVIEDDDGMTESILLCIIISG